MRIERDYSLLYKIIHCWYTYKHNEDEISFDTFKSRVENSIAEWEINLDRIFYVSKFEHEHNEIEALSSYLVEKDNHRETINDYVERIVKFITDEQLSCSK